MTEEQIVKQGSQQNKDIGRLKKLESAYSQLIQGHIKKIQQTDEISALKYKEKLLAKLQNVTLKVFSKVGTQSSSKNQHSDSSTKTETLPNNNNVTPSKSDMKDIFNRNPNNTISPSDVQPTLKQEYRSSNKDNNNSINKDDYPQRNQSSSRNNKASSNNDSEGDEYVGDSASNYSGSDDEGYKQGSRHRKHHRNHHTNGNRHHKYQQKSSSYLDKPRRGGLGIPGLSQSASINSYPMDEKRRILEFYNEHYDPAKRNKIELVEQMVKEFGYSKSSLYYLVTNQKMFEAVQMQFQMQARGSSFPQSYSYSSSNVPIYSPNTPISSYAQPKYQRDNRGDNRDIREYRDSNNRENRDNRDNRDKRDNRDNRDTRDNREKRDMRDDRYRNSNNDRERCRSPPDNNNNRRDQRYSNQSNNNTNNSNRNNNKPYSYPDTYPKDESSSQKQQQSKINNNTNIQTASDSTPIPRNNQNTPNQSDYSNTNSSSTKPSQKPEDDCKQKDSAPPQQNTSDLQNQTAAAPAIVS